MKRLLIVALAVSMILVCFAGCGKAERILYNGDLSEYVELGKYEGIEIDKSSEDFKKEYEATVASDVENNKLYEKKTKGKVAKGDTANIDYEGKKDGVAFDGGTAKGYDLGIGSGSFIPGFEDGLIGVEIGDTVDLDLTFPKDYDSEELAGAKVVFTVKVNYVTTTTALTPDKFYSELGFKTVDEYVKDAEERTIEAMLLSKLEENFKVNSYPEEDKEFLYNETKNMYVKNYVEPYGVDFATYLQSYQMTEEDFKKTMIENSITPMMKTQMIIYSILDEEKMSVSNNEIQAQAEKVAKEAGAEVTVEQVKEYYGDYYLEYIVASEKVMDYVTEKAVIK